MESMDLGIRKLTTEDEDIFQALVMLFIRVFEEQSRDIPSSSYLSQVLRDPHFHTYVYLQKGEVRGGLTAYELSGYYTKNSELYIYDIAVDTSFQNQGIGKSLIEALKEYAAAHRVENIMVEAHVEDEQAVQFYQSFQGSREQVAHFNLKV